MLLPYPDGELSEEALGESGLYLHCSVHGDHVDSTETLTPDQ